MTFFRLLVQQFNPQLLLQKATEIVADGHARNPAAVFTAWVNDQLKSK